MRIVMCPLCPSEGEEVGCNPTSTIFQVRELEKDTTSLLHL